MLDRSVPPESVPPESMPLDEPQVLVAVVQLVLHGAGALGLDRGELLAEVGVTEAQLADRDDYVPLSMQVRLGEAVARRCPGINVGLVVLEHMRVSTLGVLGYVVSHCATLRDALEAFARYQAVLSPALRWRVDPQSQPQSKVRAHPRIRIEAPPPLQRLGFPLETQVGCWLVLGRELTGVSWSPVRVQLRHHPYGPPEEFADRFGCPVEFGAPVNALELPPEVLDLPVVGARPELQPSLARLAQTLVRGQPAPEDYESRVRALLLEQLPRGLTSKEEAARRLGVSPRTLTRRLQEDGASFRELLEQVRQQLARAWLADPAVAIHEIAYLLGYSEPSTFHRSFRRWTGQTPTAWRQRSRADG